MNELRLRIAGILLSCPDKWAGSLMELPWAEYVADQLIRDLGLKRADGSRTTPVHRYVTEWIPND